MKKTITTVFLEASREKVWLSLTCENQLNSWLSEESSVELIQGGKFHLKSTIPFIEGKHEILQLEKEQLLLLKWLSNSYPTVVRIELNSSEKSRTTIKVTHITDDQLPFSIKDSLGGEAGLLKELWAYNLGLLKTYLELGEAKCRLNADRKSEKNITHVLKLKENPEKVFEAIVNPKHIKKWNDFAPEAQVDLKVGGKYSFGWSAETRKEDGPGEIVEYKEGQKITYTWHGPSEMLVCWEVEPIGNDSEFNTKLKLVHSGFIKDQNMLIEWNLGWAAFLHNLALYLEKGLSAGWCQQTFEEGKF